MPLFIAQFWYKPKGTPTDFAAAVLIVIIYFRLRDLLRRIFPNMSATLKEAITYITIIIVMMIFFKINDKLYNNKI